MSKAMTRSKEALPLHFSLVAVAIIIITLCIFIYQQAEQLQQDQKWIAHSYEIRLEVEGVDRSLRELESMQRALLLAGDGDLIQLDELFTNLRKQVETHFDRLTELVIDNSQPNQLVASTQVMVIARLDELERNARAYPSLPQDERVARINQGVLAANAIEKQLELIRESERVLLEKRSVHARTTTFRFLVLATLGTVFGIVVMFITVLLERRNRHLRQRHEARLAEARDSALNAVEVTSAFVASVSHEIRTPMNGVLGAADLLHQDSRLDPRQRELVETIRYSGEGLLALIDDILDLSKLQAGKMDITEEDFRLGDIMAEILQFYHVEISKKQLEIIQRIGPEIPEHLCGDPRRLRQVLINLIGNAVKFTDSGSVVIEASRRDEDNGNMVIRFRVIDSAPKIALLEQERLFQPFGQLDSSLTRKNHGTGLGLAISKEIVQLLGGTLGVENNSGEGNVFWFTAVFKNAASRVAYESQQPLAPESVVANESPKESPLPFARILLVEDNVINQRVFRRQIEALGMELSVCSDGGEGLEARKSGEFDVILMDCQLPTVNGFEATRRIREWENANGARRIPIIAVTAHVMAGDAEACFQSGMDDYLPKPFDLAKLKRKLGTWLECPSASSGLSMISEVPNIEILDQKQLDECLSGEVEFDHELIQSALGEIWDRETEMAKALDEDNDEAWRAGAHKACGASATLGFVGLANLFRQAEYDTGGQKEREAILPQLEEMLKRTRKHLKQIGLV